MGRPKRIWTDEQKDQITQMAEDNCHFDTIAMALDVPLESLKRCFGLFIRQKRAEGRTMLRRAQREKAINGHDTGMLCFLGKNELGQTDKQEIKHGVTEQAATLLGLIDGSSKGKLPAKGEEDE